MQSTTATESTVVEALLSRDETYTDGAYRCILQNTAKPWESTKVCISHRGVIMWAADWLQVIDWEIAGLLRSKYLGPATYGDREIYAPGV